LRSLCAATIKSIFKYFYSARRFHITPLFLCVVDVGGSMTAGEDFCRADLMGTLSINHPNTEWIFIIEPFGGKGYRKIRADAQWSDTYWTPGHTPLKMANAKIIRLGKPAN
jgi:hypothetical protein